MQNRYLPIVETGFTEDFFELDISDSDLVSRPHLEVSSSHTGQFVIRLGDDGLSGIGLSKGDYLIFSRFGEKDYHGEILLVRCEGRYIIRVSDYITPVDSVLSTPGDYFPPITLPSENIRIVCCSSGAVKNREDLHIVSFDE